MFNMVIIVNNIIYLRVAKRVDLKHSYHKKGTATIWDDRGVS